MTHSGKGPYKPPVAQPRLIRLRDAPAYLGMDKNRFNCEVRPKLMEIPIGTQGIAFDRLEMDAWVEHYISCYGRPNQIKGELIWDRKKHQGSSSAIVSGTSTNASTDGEFAKALEVLALKRRNASLQD